jgi:hypothetical protein
VRSEYEQATSCPWCDEPGRFKSTSRPARSAGMQLGTKIEYYECANERCEMYREFWAVQINVDGSIPPKGESRRAPKQFDMNRSTTERERQRARDALRILEERQQKGDYEIQ